VQNLFWAKEDLRLQIMSRSWWMASCYATSFKRWTTPLTRRKNLAGWWICRK
jgi:hypothetical protein